MDGGDDSSSIESLVLRRHAELFVQCPDCTPLLGVLRANNVINEVEYQRISAKQTTVEKNGYVIKNGAYRCRLSYSVQYASPTDQSFAPSSSLQTEHQT